MSRVASVGSAARSFLARGRSSSRIADRSGSIGASTLDFSCLALEFNILKILPMPSILFKRFTALFLGMLALGVATRAEDANNRVKVIRAPGEGKVIKAKLGSDGVAHLLIQSDAGPRYVK